jgi:hypothetical protein
MSTDRTKTKVNSFDSMTSANKNFGRGLGSRCIRRCTWVTLGVMLGCLPVAGQDEYYVNNSPLTYPGNVKYPPMVDALNFIDNSTFTINFTDVATNMPPFYATYDTVNYTNNGVMMVDSGFEFETQSSETGAWAPAANFVNPGSVYGGSANDTSDPYHGLLAWLGHGQCLVVATNITISGVVDVGENGLIQLIGQNIDLAMGLVNIESGAGAVPDSNFGSFTNNWDPSSDLSSVNAISPPFQTAPGKLSLFPAAAYTNVVMQGSNVIYRAVFIQDMNPANVAVSVFFGPNPELGNGDVTVQWASSYQDPASGNSYDSYLYLNDDYVLGASTNVLPILDTPANFILTPSSVPLLSGPGTPQARAVGFYPVGGVSAYYDVANWNIGMQVSTNNIANHSVTNLPGRIEICCASNLDLRLAQLTGANYVSLSSTNQFYGADGALIESPYADLNLGNDDGFLTVSNVLAGALPGASGTIVAWNTRWIVPDPIISGQTNDYRVLIISSGVSPTLLPQVQNLILHGTNSTVISDSFNVYGTFSCDAQSLTLTTNAVGYGATSFDGELNLEQATDFSQSSVPNLRYLTNCGAIRTAYLFNFGFPSVTNYSSTSASGTLSETGTNAVQGDKVRVGTNQYVFVGTLTNTVANQVAIVRGSFDSSMSNLIAAINGSGAGGSGVSFSSATTANPSALAGGLNNHAFVVTAVAAGTNGNSVVTTFTPAKASVNLSWGGYGDLYGGGTVTNVVSFLSNSAFINNGILTNQGSIIYAGNFESGGLINNGIGEFVLQSLTTTLTNGILAAGADVSITASRLVTGNLLLHASRSLTLQATNLLTDLGPASDNQWAIGSASVGSGFNLPIKPVAGDLLGTTLTLSAPTNRVVTSVWAGEDRGLSTAGYTNNEAIGQMIFDVSPSEIAGHNGVLAFNGTGTSNALYIDQLVLTNYAAHGNATNNYNFTWLDIGTNMMIYFAQALINGQSVAEAIDDQGKLGANNGRLRWVCTYTGYYSSTNLYYTNMYGTVYTKTVNTALAQSSHIDSDADGIPNLADPTPFFLPDELNFSATVTDLPPQSVRVQWRTIPNATNYVYFTTNFTATNWLPFTNFNNWYFGNNVAVTNPAHGNSFVSPQIYINNASLPDNSQQTNVWLYDTISDVPHYYKVVVCPWLDFEP